MQLMVSMQESTKKLAGFFRIFSRLRFNTRRGACGRACNLAVPPFLILNCGAIVLCFPQEGDICSRNGRLTPTHRRLLSVLSNRIHLLRQTRSTFLRLTQHIHHVLADVYRWPPFGRRLHGTCYRVGGDLSQAANLYACANKGTSSRD